ncbi:UNVERIFIED_CONTAM: hypothetical protein GTU68_025849 [Idotea baltica]|nr:hypothetical protein [Idotea baltica]
MGESFGIYQIGNDDLIMPYITSCNIACGFHAGDPVQMMRTLHNAKTNQLRIGAHPGYEDRAGFGRRFIKMSTDELSTSIKYQVSALIGMAKSIGAFVSFVKPHGALYNAMAVDYDLSEIVAKAIKQLDGDLAVMGMAGSLMKDVTSQLGMTFISEAFIDRKYTSDGHLLSRSKEGAVIENVEIATAQFISIATDQKVVSDDGSRIPIDADTLCIHGDNPMAVEILKSISEVRKHGSAFN